MVIYIQDKHKNPKQEIEMKLVKRENDEIKEIRSIQNIDYLENSELVLLERGDKIKKNIKGANTVFGVKNLYSVKSMKDAIAINIEKMNKRNKSRGALCVVCCDYFLDHELDERGICPHCQLS